MKGVKTILAFFLGAAYASSWWNASVFGYVFWIIPIIFTLTLSVICLCWLMENWDR